MTRNRNAHGHTWLITFVDMPYDGNLFNRLSVSSVGMIGSSPNVYVGTRPEVQSFSCSGDPTSAADYFSLTFLGKATVVPASTTASGLADLLSSTETFGTAWRRAVVTIAGGQTTVCATSSPKTALAPPHARCLAPR